MVSVTFPVTRSVVGTVTRAVTQPEGGGAPEGSAFATTLGSAAFGDNIDPASFYDPVDERTWLFWQDQPGGAGTAYNLSCRTEKNGELTPVIIIATNGLVDDNHGSPSGFMDDDGYVHVAYGSHNSTQRFVSTTFPRDPAQWNAPTNGPGDTSYPHWTLIGATAFLGARVNSRSFYMHPYTTASGVLTPGTPVHCVDFGVGTRFYQGTHVVVGNDIHVVATRADGGDTERRNIYYYVVVTDGAGAITGIRNFDNTVTIVALDFPVDLTESDTSFKIYTHPGGELWTGGPDHCIDTNSHPHVAFTKGADVSSVTDILHLWHNGTAWQAVDTVRADTPEIFGGVSITAGAAGKIEVWYYDDPAALFSAGGDMHRKVWDAGVFGSEELIRAHSATGPVSASQAVRFGKPALRTIYRRSNPDPAAFAHGDFGPFVFSSIYTPTNAEAAAYFARLSVQPVSDEKFWIDRLFSVIKELNIATFDAFYLRCMGAEADGLLNILSTDYPSVNNGATFTAGEGFTTDGIATFVDTSVDPTLTAAFTRDSAIMGFICLSNVGINASALGWFDGADGTVCAPRLLTSDDISFRINQAGNSVAAVSSALPALLTLNRSLSNATQLYRNDGALTVGTLPNQTSTAPNAVTFKLGWTSNTPSFCAQRFALDFYGGSHTAGQVATLYNKGILPLMQYKGLI